MPVPAAIQFVPGRALLPSIAVAVVLLSSVGAAAATPPLAGPLADLPILMDVSQAAPQATWTPMQDEPPVPGVQDGLGPGSAMQQRTGSTGFICTAAFLLRDPTTGTYYLSTAGHCLVRDDTDPTPYTGAANPDKMHEEFSICVAGCIDNALGVGTYVTLRADDAGHPAVYARSGGVGADFGILRLPDDVHDVLRPAIPQWGGPTGLDAGASGDFYVHFGHGSYCCPVTGSVASRTPADQGRVAVSLGADADAFQALGSISGGDSGSGIARGIPNGDVLVGAEAVGVITHGTIGVGVIMSGTVLSKGLAMVEGATGLKLELVQEGDPLPRGPTAEPPEAPTEALAIRAPRHGATLDVDDKRVHVEGTADPGTPWGEGLQVQVAVDDPQFGFDRRVPVRGNATWNATWDLAGESLGTHTLRARLVDAEGAVLAQHNISITLVKDPPASSTSSSASRSPSSLASTASTWGSAGPGGTNATASDAPRPAPAPAGAIGLAAVAIAALVRRRHAA